MNRFTAALESSPGLESLPLLVLVDDAEFAARNLRNFLWVTFTRSNPSHDLHGVGSFIDWKHWGCRGPLIVDARLKPHHAPPLVEDPAVSRAVDALAENGKSLHGLW
jgi:4-hydroxy-3-polyprenylbenzoate decarboxylase